MLLGRRGLPKKPRDRIGVCSFGDLGELQCVLGSTWGVDVLRGSCRMGVEDLDLGSVSNHQLSLDKSWGTHKVVAVFEIAANCYFACAICLRPPFAPVKGIDGPGGHVVARARLGMRNVVTQSTRAAI